jgi:hypothetical protein
MKELEKERKIVQAVLSDDHTMYGWLWEYDAGARPTPTRETFLQEVAKCDIYLGLFWLNYGPYTIEEYEYARTCNKPCLVYKKQVDTEKRDPQLTDFLKKIEDVNNPKGLTVRWFTTNEQLEKYVREDVFRLLTDVFRQSRQQPTNGPITNHSTGGTLSTSDLVELTELLLKCTAIIDRAQREVVISLIAPDITQRIRRGDTGFTDVLEIVKGCAEYDEGIAQLMQATRTIDGNTRSVQAVMVFLRKRGFRV